MSTLKVGTIQDHANSNTAITIDSSGRVTMPQSPNFTSPCLLHCQSKTTVANGHSWIGLNLGVILGSMKQFDNTWMDTI